MVLDDDRFVINFPPPVSVCLVRDPTVGYLSFDHSRKAALILATNAMLIYCKLFRIRQNSDDAARLLLLSSQRTL